MQLLSVLYSFLVLSFAHGATNKDRKVKRRGILFGNDIYSQYQLVQVPAQYNPGQALPQTSNPNQYYSLPDVETTQQPLKDNQWNIYNEYYGSTYQKPRISFQYQELNREPQNNYHLQTITEVSTEPTTTQVPPVTEQTFHSTASPNTIYYIISNPPNPNQLENASKYFPALNAQTATTEVPTTQKPTLESSDVTLSPIKYEESGNTAPRLSRYAAMRLLQSAVCNSGLTAVHDGIQK